MKSGMFIPLCALCAGILATGAGADILWASYFLISGCLIYLYLIYKGKDPLRRFKLLRYHLVWPAFIFFGIGILSGDINRPFLIRGEPSLEFSEALGHVRKISTTTRGDQLEIDVISLYNHSGEIITPYNLRTILYTDVSDVSVDDVIRFPAKFELIEDSSNHLYSGYARMLSDKGINYCLYLNNGDIAVVDSRTTLNGLASGFRDRIESHIELSGLSRHTKNLLIPILLGDRQYLEPNVRTLFADAGISHILALSGLHVAIIVGIVFFLLFPLNFAGLYKQRIVVAILILWGYTFIAGLPLSAVRASLMLTFIAFALFLERKGSAFNALCISVFIILLLSPLSIHDAGLQLSVVCVASLILFAERLNPVDRKAHPLLYKSIGFVVATIVTTFASWALTVFYFRQFPAMFFIINLITLPFLPIYLIASVIYLLFSAVGYEPVLFTRIIDSVPEVLESLITFIVGGETVFKFSISSFTVILWLGALVGIAGFIYCRRFKKAYMVSAVTLVLLSFLSIPFTGANVANNGFILCNYYHDLLIRELNNGIETDYKISKGCVSKIDLYGKTIVSVDCNPAEEHLLNSSTISSCDFLLLTGSLTENVEDVIRKFRPYKVVIHPTVRKDREIEIINHCNELKLPYHSLRMDKALRVVAD